MELNEIILLVVSGIVVGIFNTLGGGGSVISMALFMAMGLPVSVANGTNRIAVVLQNLSSTLTFIRKRMLDIKSSLLLSIPAILGNIIGSMVAMEVDETIFKICLSVVLAVILIYLIFDRDIFRTTLQCSHHHIIIRDSCTFLHIDNAFLGKQI